MAVRIFGKLIEDQEMKKMTKLADKGKWHELEINVITGKYRFPAVIVGAAKRMIGCDTEESLKEMFSMCTYIKDPVALDAVKLAVKENVWEFVAGIAIFRWHENAGNDAKLELMKAGKRELVEALSQNEKLDQELRNGIKDFLVLRWGKIET